jgi:hypothetical protein
MGAMQALAPASALEAVEKAIKAGPALDSETRAARIAACEAKIGALILSLSHEPFDDCRGALFPDRVTL